MTRLLQIANVVDAAQLPETMLEITEQGVVFHGVIKTEADVRRFLALLEAEVGKWPQIDLPLKHTFTSGIYAREIFLPKGTLVVGKIHRHDHLNFISFGDVSVLTKDGIKHIVGPCTMVSTAGTKRAVYAHEDTVWTTIHANPANERDLDVIEDFVIAKNYDEFPLQDEVATVKDKRMPWRQLKEHIT
jgi:hypothetical protein